MTVTTTDTVAPLGPNLIPPGGPGSVVGGPPGGFTPTPAAPTAAPPSAADQSAKGVIAAALDTFGLGTLGGWAWNKYLAGEPVQQIMLELRQTPEYQARFPAMAGLAKQGEAITEQQYIDYERGVTQLLHAHGIPNNSEFNTPAAIASYLLGGQALTEVDRRLSKAQDAAYNAPPQVKDEFTRLYGTAAPGLSTAWWLDPTVAEPLLEKQYTSAQIAAQAGLTGFGQIDRTQAEALAGQGIDQTQAQQGFTSLGRLGDIYRTVLPGEQALTSDQLIGAQFGGNVEDQRAIAQRAARRTAAFSGGGQVAAGNTGYTGAGSAQGA